MLSLLLLSILGNFWLINGQTVVNRTFVQPATIVGSSIVCVGSSQTFNCTIEAFISPVGFVITGAIWSINGVIITDSTPRHTLLQTQHGVGPVVTGLMVNNTTLGDNGTVYSCTTEDAPDNFTSSVTLNVVGEIPPVENLTAVDQCTTIITNWDITEGPCTDLYNVTLLSSDGIILQGPLTTRDTVYNFNDVETLNGTFNVSVVPFNGNLTGADVTEVVPNLQGVTNFNVSRICVTYFNVSWDAPSITCEDIVYEVSISPSPIKGDAVTNTNDTSLSVTGLNNSLLDVTITVTTINRGVIGDGRMFSVQLLESLSPPQINDLVIYSTGMPPVNTTPACINTPDDLSGYDVFLYWTRPSISDPCTTLPVSIYDVNITINDVRTINGLVIETFRIPGTFNISFNKIFDEQLMPNTTYCFNVTARNIQSVEDDESDLKLMFGMVDLAKFNVGEGDGAFRSMIYSTKPLSTDMTAQVDTTDITTRRDDYTPGPYTVIFYAGQTNASLMIPVTNDRKSEDDEMFMLTISFNISITDDKRSINSLLSTGVTAGEAIVTIVDDDDCGCICEDEIIIIIIACVAGVFFISCTASIYCTLKLIEEDSCNREYNRPSCYGLFTFALFSCGISLIIWSSYQSCCRKECKEDKCCCKKDYCGYKKIQITEIFFLLCSLGLGCLMWAIYNIDCCHCCWRSSSKGSSLVQPRQNIELEEKQIDPMYDAPDDVAKTAKKDDVAKTAKKHQKAKPAKKQHKGKEKDSTYDSPGIQNEQQVPQAAENQALYSYARTGPVNVIIPGSANS